LAARRASAAVRVEEMRGHTLRSDLDLAHDRGRDEPHAQLLRLGDMDARVVLRPERSDRDAAAVAAARRAAVVLNAVPGLRGRADVQAERLRRRAELLA